MAAKQLSGSVLRCLPRNKKIAQRLRQAVIYVGMMGIGSKEIHKRGSLFGRQANLNIQSLILSFTLPASDLAELIPRRRQYSLQGAHSENIRVLK